LAFPDFFSKNFNPFSTSRVFYFFLRCVERRKASTAARRPGVADNSFERDSSMSVSGRRIEASSRSRFSEMIHPLHFRDDPVKVIGLFTSYSARRTSDEPTAGIDTNTSSNVPPISLRILHFGREYKACRNSKTH
jgi:hypothetical protein